MIKPLENYTDYDSAATNSPYHPILAELYAIIQARFPMGPSNRWDVAQELTESQLHQCLYELSNYDVLARAQVKTTKHPSRLIDLMQHIKHGNCEMLASYAQGYMLNTHPEVLTEVMYLDDHAILLLGRKNDSNPQDISTWGDDALLIDFWGEFTCLSQNLLQIRPNIPDAPACLKAINPYTGAIKNIIKSTTHYLTGNPKVYACAISAQYDLMFMRWVKADLALQQQEIAVSRISNTLSQTSFGAQCPPKLIEKYKLTNGEQDQLEKGLRRAASLGHVPDMQIFLTYVTNINAQDATPTSMKTALHWAAQNNHPACYEALVRAGAQDDIPNAQGKTPHALKLEHDVPPVDDVNITASI